VIFSIQTDATGVAFDSQSANAYVGYSYIAGNNPNGNMLTGQSQMVLVGASVDVGHPEYNLRIRALDLNPSNPILLPGGGTIPYVNILVMISNHSWTQRAAGQ
jgi:hypothetical protein